MGTLSGLNCAGAIFSADLVAGKSSDGTILTIPYTSGNGGVYDYWATASTGLQGLTASLAAGTLTLGAGNLQYVLTGTKPTAGTANFNISIGGQSCTVSKTVAPQMATLDCARTTFGTALVEGKPVNSTLLTIPYTGGNGGGYTGQAVASTGVSGLTAALPSGHFSEGAGNLVYAVQGSPQNPGTATFGISILGQSCTISQTVAPASIASLDCAGATLSADLVQGKTGGSTLTIPYTGGNGGRDLFGEYFYTSTGVDGLEATLFYPSLAEGSGTFLFRLEGTPSSSGTANFNISIGGQSCTVSRVVLSPNQ